MSEQDHSTRRDFLKTAAAGTVALSAGGALLAACGSDSSGSSSATSAATTSATQKAGGTLNIGMTGGATSDTLSSFNPLTLPDYARAVNLYEPLVRMNAEGLPELALAEEFTPNKDATEWTIRLHKGVTFHNGKEVTADDVIWTLQAITNPKSPGEAAALITPIDAKNAKKVDKYTVSLPCTTPFATLTQALSVVSMSGIVPVDYDPKTGMGAGPFKLDTYTPGVESTFLKNPDYYKTGLPYADKLVITEYADETSQVNALLGGQVQAITGLSAQATNQVTGAGKKIMVSPGGGWNPFVMNTTVAPFDDVRVRQALKLVVDRDEMLNVVFGGKGTIGNDIMGIWAPEYDTSIPQRVQDIDQAKSLLRQAGKSDLTIELTIADIAQGVVSAAQVFVQQAKAAGVTVNIKKLPVADFYGPNYLSWPFSIDYWYYDLYLPAVALATLPTSPFPETQFNNKQYNSLYATAVASLDTGARNDAAHQMQMIEYNQGGYIIPFFVPVIDGYDPSVQGVVSAKNGAPFNEYDYKSLSLA